MKKVLFTILLTMAVLAAILGQAVPVSAAAANPQTQVGISAFPNSGIAPYTTILTVTETNTGNQPLFNIWVDVSTGDPQDPPVVWTPLYTLSNPAYSPPNNLPANPANTTFEVDSGNDGKLSPGETWTWNVTLTVNISNTFIATGHGIYKKLLPDRTIEPIDITYPLCASERLWTGVNASFPEVYDLGDFVWHDLNANGIQDPGEPGIEMVTVELYDQFGGLIDSTTTDEHGNYLFNDLPSDLYSVKFIPPIGSGYTFSPKDQVSDDPDDNNDAVDSDADSTGMVTGFFLAFDDMTWDAGLYQTLDLDLAIVKTDGLTIVSPGQQITYTLTVTNNGPANAIGATVTDSIPSTLTAVTWTSSPTGSAEVTSGGSGSGYSLNETVNIPAGAGNSVVFSVHGTVPANAAAEKLVDFTTLGAENTQLAQNVTVNGVQADAFYLSGGSYLTANTYLWLRNVTNDHGLGVYSPGENPTNGGDENEISNQRNKEVVRLQKNDSDKWTSLWVSSLDSGGSNNQEMGTLYWSNNAAPDLSTLTGFTFHYGQFGTSVEGNLLSLNPTGFDSTAKYLFFIAGPNPFGDNNDYLLWKATTAAFKLTNTAVVQALSGVTDINLSNNSATDTDTLTVIPPAVTTNAASNITKYTARLNGNLTSLGSATTVKVYFEYGRTASYGSATALQPKTATGTFYATISSLNKGTTYHFRAVVVGSDGTKYYGSDKSFRTSYY